MSDCLAIIQIFLTPFRLKRRDFNASTNTWPITVTRMVLFQTIPSETFSNLDIRMNMYLKSYLKRIFLSAFLTHNQMMSQPEKMTKLDCG